MTTLTQLAAVQDAAEIAEKQLGYIFQAMELLASDINASKEPIGANEVDQWVVVLRWLSGHVMEQEERLYTSLQHDAVAAARAER